MKKRNSKYGLDVDGDKADSQPACVSTAVVVV